MTAVLSSRARNRALLARQLLLRRHELTAAGALEHLVGLQAQAPMPPYTGLWTRLRGFQPDELVELLTGRAAVRIALMRSTVHLVTARDCVTLRPLLQPAVQLGLYSTPAGRAMAGVDVDKLLAVARELLDERPRTTAELGAALRERFPDRPAESLARHVRGLLPLVQVPPRGLWGRSGQARCTTAETWLGEPLSRTSSLDTLVTRYLAAFGPASVLDIQKWSGLTKLGEIVEALRPELRAFRDEQGRELFDLPDAPRPGPETSAPPRFLPEFDNLLLSHADREHILTEEHRKRLFTKNGLIPATILVNGTVRGTWKIERAKQAATLVIQPFCTLSKKDTSGLVAEGGRLLRFTAPEADHDVRFTPAG
ncbi:winged helix DNA-binding domain-containing protein [Amycolatopsis anabasis]|uniref:winged helix DNA-binding domain-containing protein n=1 Tax=Amycolatopsis anabasis TaxID=1840409 RepID=UPI00131A84FF|nr:winged helix DNA-binding domain-containing protein [Amycolatopsis anabasis]